MIMEKKGKLINNSDSITVTNYDFTMLSNLIQRLRNGKSVDDKYLNFLNFELHKATKIDSKLISPDFVTMNSVISVVFLDTMKAMELRLVYPQKANFAEGLISVLSPLGCALLGYKAGDVVTYNAPKGEQKVKIEKLVFQPEANGEDLL
jgi:regulator of nucleoside diphosphate kinase